MLRSHMRRAAILLSLALLAVAIGGLTTAVQAHGRRAQATLRDATGHDIGRVKFLQQGDKVLVRAWVTGQSPGFHGFHIHANDDPANGKGCIADPAQAPSTWFVSADGHLKAAGQNHPDHTGDMPVLLVGRDGRAEASFSDDRLRPSRLAGRAVIVHALPDNYDNIPLGTAPDQYTANSPAARDKTLATGNAGDRLACGVVKRG
jgi:superoxide dismutase, Cu-Zn family